MERSREIAGKYLSLRSLCRRLIFSSNIARQVDVDSIEVSNWWLGQAEESVSCPLRAVMPFYPLSSSKDSTPVDMLIRT